MRYPGRSRGVAAKAKNQFRGGSIGLFVCLKAWLLLKGKLDLLVQVYCFPFPVQEGDQLTEETDLYTTIYNSIPASEHGSGCVGAQRDTKHDQRYIVLPSKQASG